MIFSAIAVIIVTVVVVVIIVAVIVIIVVAAIHCTSVNSKNSTQLQPNAVATDCSAILWPHHVMWSAI